MNKTAYVVYGELVPPVCFYTKESARAWCLSYDDFVGGEDCICLVRLRFSNTQDGLIPASVKGGAEAMEFLGLENLEEDEVLDETNWLVYDEYELERF